MRKRLAVILGIEVFVVFLAAALLGLFLLYPYVTDRLDARLKEESRSRARVIVTSVADQCIEPILDGDDLVLGLIIAKAAKNYGGIRWIGITDTEGEIIANTDLKLLGRKIVLPSGIRPQYQGDFMSGFYGSSDSSLWAGYSITAGQSKMGTVHIGMSAGPRIFLGETEILKRQAILIYAGLAAISAFLILLLSYRPIRNLGLVSSEARAAAVVEPEEDFAAQMSQKRKEESEIAERIMKMRDQEKELVARMKTLKKQAELSEKSGKVEIAPRFASKEERAEVVARFVPKKEEVKTKPKLVSPKEKGEAPRKFVSEKERIESIRKRIHELEERMRSG